MLFLFDWATYYSTILPLEYYIKTNDNLIMIDNKLKIRLIILLIIGIILGSGCVQESTTEPNIEQQTNNISKDELKGITFLCGDFEITKIPIESHNPTIQSKKIIIKLVNYSTTEDGTIDMGNIWTGGRFNRPILDGSLFVETQALPIGTKTKIEVDESSSTNTLIDFKYPRICIPIACAAVETEECNDEFLNKINSSPNFYPQEIYKTTPMIVSSGGAKEENIALYLIQFKSDKAKLWTKVVLDIQYQYPDNAILFINLSTDKQEYLRNDKIDVNITLANKEYTKAVDISAIFRDLITGEEITDITIGSMGVGGWKDLRPSSGIYTIDLQDIPERLKGKIIQLEILIYNCHSGNVITSRTTIFKIQ